MTESPKTSARCSGDPEDELVLAGSTATSTPPASRLADRRRRERSASSAALRRCASTVSRIRTGRPSLLDVAVERLEEAVAVLHRDQRVDEHDRVRPLVEVRSRPPAPSPPARRRRASRPGGGPSTTTARLQSPGHASRLYPGRVGDHSGRRCIDSVSHAHRCSPRSRRRRLPSRRSASTPAAPTKLIGTVGPGFTITLKKLGKTVTHAEGRHATRSPSRTSRTSTTST